MDALSILSFTVECFFCLPPLTALRMSVQGSLAHLHVGFAFIFVRFFILRNRKELFQTILHDNNGYMHGMPSQYVAYAPVPCH